jgi:cytochrome c553
LAVGDPEHGKRVAEAKCAACHGTNGNSPDPQFPKLAGQNPAYLYQQLWAFKEGTRKSDVMPGIVATLVDADMANVASFYSRQPRKPDTVKDARLAAIGERVFFNGMPSCAMCHGSGGRPGMPMMGMMGRGMMGMMGSGMADVPNLNGQHAGYVIDQLNRFAGGERQGTVMNRIAPTLSETNKEAVAEFLAGTP